MMDALSKTVDKLELKVDSHEAADQTRYVTLINKINNLADKFDNKYVTNRKMTMAISVAGIIFTALGVASGYFIGK